MWCRSGLAFALALAATHAFLPGTTPQLRQRVAPASMSANPDSTLDPESARRLQQIISEKEEAVAAEDYEAAKRLKRAEETLRRYGGQLAQLEAAKRQAVDAEDYDRAKTIKADIDAVWNRIESRGPDAPPSGGGGAARLGGAAREPYKRKPGGALQEELMRRDTDRWDARKQG